jgi:RHS repeat-associated protein
VTRLETGPDPRFGMQAPVATAITVATPGGRTARVTTEIKAALGTPDDPLSLESLTEVIRINGRPFTTAYDASSKTITATSPLGRVARLRLDDQGGVVETQVGGLLPIEYRYDNRGRLEVATQGGGLEARVIELTYDGSGYVDGFTAPDGRTTRFSYDDAGRLDSYRRHDDSLTVYGYDASGNIEVVRPPARRPHSYNYTPLNQLATSTPPPVGAQPAETTYRYDQDRQLQRVERPNNQIVDLAYDGAGSLVTLNISEGSLQFGIDAGTGHVLTVMAPGGVALSYAYDGPLMTGETWTGPVQGMVARTYDDNLRATSQTVTGGDNIGFTYDQDGLLIGAGELSLIREGKSGLPSGSTLGGMADSWTYSRFGEIDSYSVAHGPAGIYAFTFLRDEVGRITTKTEDLGGTVHTYGYAYDSVGRLEQVQRDGAVIAAYDYDANGNRTTAATPSGTVSAEYDDQDRLEAYGGTVFAYMPGGELRSKTTGGQSTVYDYDALSNLRAVHLPDGSRVDYLIDGQNRRVGKRINNTLLQGFLYEGDRLVAELAPGSSIVSRFIYGVRQVPEYMIKNGARFRVVSDHLGSPRLVVNADTGQVVQRITYSEFGEVLEDTNPGFQPFGFAGGLYDRHTGLVRFGARDYDAVTGRWTSKDPIGFNGGDTNLYAYALNDPINFLDPDGLDVWDAFGDWVWRSGAAEWDLTQEANFLAGFADVLTLGGTKALRDLQDFYGDPARPLSEIISRCSSSYAAGKYVGAVFGLIINSAGAVRAHARIKDLAREARRWRGAMRAATRRGPSQPAVKVMRPGQAPRKGGPRPGDPGRFDDLPIRRW